MRIPRIYTDISLIAGNTIDLPNKAASYIYKVLRLREKDQIVLFNGLDNCEYTATLISANNNSCQVSIDLKNKTYTSPVLEIHLGLCLSKGERMDFAIQKSIELGVKEITPLFSQRTVVKLSAERQQKRLQHWQSIVISACEQCGRVDIPHVNDAVTMPQWLEAGKPTQTLLLHPELQTEKSFHLNELNLDSKKLGLLIGPEGGFDDNEVKQAIKSGCTTVQLGPRVLRTETAPLAAISAIQTLWGDFC